MSKESKAFYLTMLCMVIFVILLATCHKSHAQTHKFVLSRNDSVDISYELFDKEPSHVGYQDKTWDNLYFILGKESYQLCIPEMKMVFTAHLKQKNKYIGNNLIWLIQRMRQTRTAFTKSTQTIYIKLSS